MDNLVVNFYNVEHGLCVHIITPNNKHILVDVGSKQGSSISDYINNVYFGGHGGKIDLLYITHTHEDHLFDLPRLNKILCPKSIIRPKKAFNIVPENNTGIHKVIADVANHMNVIYNHTVSNDANILNSIVNGGIDFYRLTPKDEWCSKDDPNTFSPVIVMSYKGIKFVITGDNPQNILDEMIDNDYSGICDKVCNADFLLAPHHGRETSFSEKFFHVVNPKLTIVSDKCVENASQERTSELYHGRGIPFLDGSVRYVLTTRNDGNISVVVNSNGVYQVTTKAGGY